MQSSPSKFGQVLIWVRDQLKKVETDMTQDYEGNKSLAHKSVRKAQESIDELLNHDEELKSDFIQIAEIEYQRLVDEIQLCNEPITPEIRRGADEMRRKVEGL